jgi:sugar phosphate isomerase/epimerase
VLTKQQFGFNAYVWRDLDADQRVKECTDFLAQVGYGCVEFSRDSFSGNDLCSRFRAAAKAAETSGIRESTFTVVRDLVCGDWSEIDDVVRAIEASSEAGREQMNLCSYGTFPEHFNIVSEHFWMPPQPNYQEPWDNVSRALEVILTACERNAVTVNFEAAVGALVHDYYSVLELLRRCGHPRLCILMDPSHYVLYRNDVPYAVRQLGPKIRHVHMKDAVGRPGTFGLDFMFPPLGAGAMDWGGFFRALEDINYTGALSAEYEQFKYMAHVRNDDPKFAARVSYEEMNMLYDHYHQR